MQQTRPLKILHVFRSPVGGLFRHVVDLARGQAERGHDVGLILSNLAGDARSGTMLDTLAPLLKLGVASLPVRRSIDPRDFGNAFAVSRRIRETGADVIHGHGAKGGAYARLAPAPAHVARVYTPHGGSLLYGHDTLGGRIYLNLERLLMLRRTLFLFESGFSAEVFREKIGEPRGIARVVHNGIGASDLEPVTLRPDAADLLFLGELRMIKGIDVLLHALARLRQEGMSLTLNIVGDGPDRERLVAITGKLMLETQVSFCGVKPAREALAFGRIMVVPSRFESLPYVVLEGAGAAKPLIATRVGGIHEIMGDQQDLLIPPDDEIALAAAIRHARQNPDLAQNRANQLRRRVATSFSVDAMVDSGLAAYRDALEGRPA